ncbi:MAG TPA: hypothetical protein VIH59_05890, partial [Candidatus Tectomicrobia bacterium]
MAGVPQPEHDGHCTMPQPEAPEPWLSRDRALALVLITATALALFLCYLLLHPFLPALAWALALAVVTHPVYTWLLSHVVRPNLAAGLAVVLVALLLIAPALFVLRSLAGEVAGGVERLQTEAATGRWRGLIERNPQLAPALRWLETHVDVQSEVQRAFTLLTAR